MLVRNWQVIASSLCLCMATTGCSVQHRPKLTYSGQLTSQDPSCPKTRGTLIVQRGVAVFTPTDGTWTLEGKATDKTVEASLSRPSFDHKTFTTELKATLTDTLVSGTYVTPTCTYTVSLMRV